MASYNGYSSETPSLGQSMYTTLSTNNHVNQTTIHTVQFIVSEQTYQTIRLVVGGFMTVIITAVGIPGNLINCLVFQRQGLKYRMNLSLFCLSLMDLLFLVSSLGFSLVILLVFFGMSEEHYLRAIQTSTGVICAFKATSACFNMVITVERCLCVMLPLRATSLIRTSTMALIMASTSIIVQLGYLPLALKYQVRKVELNGITQWQLVLSETGLKYKNLIDKIVLSGMSTIIPLVTIAVATIATFIILVRLRTVMKWRKTISSTYSDNEQQQTALAQMFVGVSIKFIIVTIPFTATILTHLSVPDFATAYSTAYLSLTCTVITSLFSAIDCSLNFCIYYTRSSHFSAECRKIGSRNFKELPSSVTSVTVTQNCQHHD